MTSGIYKITFISNVKDMYYIGSSKDIEKRIKGHKRDLKGRYHNNKYLQSDFDIHGEVKFKFEIIEIVEDLNKLTERETYYIEKYKSYYPFGYNIERVGTRNNADNWTDEKRQNMSESLKKYYENNDSPFKGKTHSDEAKKAMSESKKLLTGDKNPFYGKNHSEESKRKMVENRSVYSPTEEHRKTISETHRGSNCTFSKLEEEDVILIIKLIQERYRTKDIAKKFNVGYNTINDIKIGKTWSHLSGGKVKVNHLFD